MLVPVGGSEINGVVMRILILMLFTLACGACRSAPPPETRDDVPRDLSIALDQTAYASDDVAQLTITNNTDELVLFALVCDGFVEGRERDEWQTVFEPDCSQVRVVPTRLEGGDNVVAELPIQISDQEMLPKYYAFRVRMTFQFADSGGYHTAYSSWFSISAP